MDDETVDRTDDSSAVRMVDGRAVGMSSLTEGSLVYKKLCLLCFSIGKLGFRWVDVGFIGFFCGNAIHSLKIIVKHMEKYGLLKI